MGMKRDSIDGDDFFSQYQPMKRMMRWLTGWAAVAGVLLFRCATMPEQYVSLDPQAAYAGMASCQPCHQRIYREYLETGMGRSMHRPDPARRIERFDAESVVQDPKLRLAYHPFWEDGRMFIREFRLDGADTVYQRTEQVDYVVGSGHQTRSYLMERNGYLYEMPLTWYVEAGVWDLSPGYEVQNSRFSREIGQECMGCHTGKTEFVPGSKHRYREISLGIDCEKCHGPGQRHIELMQAGHLVDVGEHIDYSIVNPGKLPASLQFDVCQQCHLQGINIPRPGRQVEEYRPAMRLQEVYDVFLEQHADPDAFGIASHAERLQQSRCFLESEGRLTCTTCHNPHKQLSRSDTAYYVRRCQSCHRTGHEPLCSAAPELLQAQRGDCVSCHMPAGGTRDIPHVRFHDHRIRVLRSRNPGQAAGFSLYASAGASADAQGRAWLAWFEQQEPDPAWLDRAAGLLSPASADALARVARYQGRPQDALRLARQALAANPADPDLLFLTGELLEDLRQFQEAHDCYAAIFQAHPEAWEAGLKQAVTLLKARSGDRAALDEARALLETLRQMKPFEPRVLQNLGFVALNQGRWDEAERLFVEALRYDPDYRQALDNLALIRSRR